MSAFTGISTDALKRVREPDERRYFAAEAAVIHLEEQVERHKQFADRIDLEPRRAVHFVQRAPFERDFGKLRAVGGGVIILNHPLTVVHCLSQNIQSKGELLG